MIFQAAINVFLSCFDSVYFPFFARMALSDKSNNSKGFLAFIMRMSRKFINVQPFRCNINILERFEKVFKLIWFGNLAVLFHFRPENCGGKFSISLNTHKVPPTRPTDHCTIRGSGVTWHEAENNIVQNCKIYT